MKPKYIVGLIILLIFVILILYKVKYEHSHYNTTPILVINEHYKVHRKYNNKYDAANLLSEVTKRNHKLMDHLHNKYLPEIKIGDPSHKNRIDIIDSIPEIDLYIQERIEQLFNKYDQDRIYEISPLNSSGLTSYTQDKKDLILCLRKKENANQLHDINVVMFVVIHELTHMMNNKWGHEADFWKLFKFMLDNAVEINIYQPVDYSIYPIVYCGLKLTYNPYFDKSLSY